MNKPTRPTLFKGEMVRAILEGRKTQTRRVVGKLIKPVERFQFVGTDADTGKGIWEAWRGNEPVNAIKAGKHFVKCHMFTHSVGDLLWVRESWRPIAGYGAWDLVVYYQANFTTIHFEDGDVDVGDWSFPKAAKKGNVPSIFMPRWASRITLEVTDVRVQRLQDIDGEDAVAEGVEMVGEFPAGTTRYRDYSKQISGTSNPVKSFRSLWDSINAKREGGKLSWASNPWVVAYTFKPIFKNVDQVLLELANPEGDEHG